MKQRLRLLFLFSFFLILTYPMSYSATQLQSSTDVTGKVIDDKGNAVPFAIIALNNTGTKSPAIFGTSNDSGVFEFKQLPVGTYNLQISYIGYDLVSHDVTISGERQDVGVFTIKLDIELEAAVISARRDLTKTSVDRLTYNVASDPDAKNSNALQILNKVPFVSINRSSNKIKVFGSESGFTILLNGKKSLYLSESNQYLAEMMEAGKIKKIELITSPDGKYITQNAVINIITESELPDALAIQVSMSGSSDNSYSPILRLTSKLGKMIFNIDYNYNYSNSYGSEIETKITDYNSDRYRYSENSIRSKPAPSHSHSGMFNASYDISPNDLFVLTFNTDIRNNFGDITSNLRSFDQSNVVTRDVQQVDQNANKGADYKGSLSYQRSFKDKPGRLFTATYSIDSKDADNMTEREYLLTEGYDGDPYKTQNQLSNIENTIGVDFYNPIKPGNNYYFTAKYIDRKYGSESWMYNPSGSNGNLLQGFNYSQRVGVFEGNYSVSGKKAMLTALLSYEYTEDNADFIVTETSYDKKDHTLLGRLRFTYRLGKSSTIIANLDKSAFRPDIIYLNPYEDKSVAGRVVKGNPNLDSEDGYSAMIMFRHSFSDIFSINSINTFRYSDNAVQQYSYTDGNGTIITTFGNISTKRTLFFTLGMQIKPIKKIEIGLNGRIGWFDFEYESEKNSYWDPFIMLSLNWQPWKGGNFFSQISFTNDRMGQSPNIQANKQQYLFEGLFSYRQDITNALSLYLGVANPWTKYRNVNLEEGSLNFYNIQTTRTLVRRITFGITYNFGRLGERVKSSRRTIKNIDRNKED